MQDAAQDSQARVDRACLQRLPAESLCSDLCREARDVLACNLRQRATAQRRIALQCANAWLIPRLPGLGGVVFESSLRPGLKAVLDEITERRAFLLPDTDQPFGESSTVRRFHFAGSLVITLLRGFSDELPAPHEFVPVDRAAFVDRHD